MPTAFDRRRFGLAAAALASLVFELELTSRPGAGRGVAGLLILGTALAIAYVRHARRRSGAILDLRLLAVPTFRVSVVAGSLAQLTQGAQPFLLPLMLQLAFGLSRAKAGTITLAAHSVPWR